MNSPKRSARKHPVLRVISIFTLASLCTVVIGIAATYIYLDPQIPEAATFRNVTLEAPLRIYAKDGELIGEFGERRLIPIDLEDVPQDFINAILDTEDKRFYQHNGIDYISLVNDVMQLVASLAGIGNERLGGASTITMQLARNVSFTLERSFLRKFKEMLLSLKIEQELSKEEILELYINLVPFGKRAYGAEAAAITYYGKSLDELNLAQLAMLAGTPQRPEAGNPINGPEWALRRRNQVLGRMLAQNSISRDQYESAVAAPITARVYARELDLPSPYIAEWARQQVTGLVPDLYTGGYEIYTTIDGSQQRAATQALRQGLLKYDHDHGYRGPEGQLSEPLLSDIKQLFNNDQSTALPPSTDSVQQTPEDSAAQQARVTNDVIVILATYTPYEEQTPAAVLSMDDDSALVMTESGALGTVALADSRWARPYISVDELGPRPQRMADILKVGDIVRVNTQGQIQTPNQNSAQPNETPWLLTQLPEIQGALIAMDPNNGAVRALMGGYDFYRNQYNYALQAQRQPGSGFKPFIYSSALSRGITPADIFLDAPLVFEDANLESQYRPENDNNRYNGPTRLREALYRSINLVSMRVLLKIGAGRALRDIRKFGFDMTSFPRNTQLALGGGTMTVAPLDMAKAYAVLANGGYLVEPYVVDRLVDQHGKVLFAANPARVCPSCEGHSSQENLKSSASEAGSIDGAGAGAGAEKINWLRSTVLDQLMNDAKDTQPEQASAAMAPRVLDQRNAFIMQSMLRDVIKRGTGRRARALGRNDLAGKTGTTNDASDTWFNGFNPSLVASVWVGFKDQEPLGRNAYGSNIPLPIWIDFMRQALRGVPEQVMQQPPGVVNLRVDRDTGLPTSASNAAAIDEVFLAEYAPEPAPAADTGNAGDDDIRAVDLF